MIERCSDASRMMHPTAELRYAGRLLFLHIREAGGGQYTIDGYEIDAAGRVEDIDFGSRANAGLDAFGDAVVDWVGLVNHETVHGRSRPARAEAD